MNNNSFFERLVPSLVTSFSLYFGLVATIALVDQNYKAAAIAVFIGVFSDMCDDFFARMFGTTTKFTKEFDTFANLVVGGIVPGMVMYSLLLEYPNSKLFYLAGLIPLFAAIRLSRLKSSGESRQTFKGLRVDVCSLFIVGLPFLKEQFPILLSTPVELGAICIAICLLMNAPVRLLKVKIQANIAENWYLFVLGIVAIASILAIGLGGISLTVLLYIILSLFTSNKTEKKAQFNN